MAMTPAEQIHQRALDRAKAERLQTFRLMSGQYAVRSRKLAPGSFHVVSQDAAGALACDAQCPGYFYRGVCAHTATVERRVARERRSAAS